MRDPKDIGLHLRMQCSLDEMIERADFFDLSIFQCFFVLQATGKLSYFSNTEIQHFLKIRRERFHNLYVHGSYWINLASLGYNGNRALERELNLAKKLEFTHIVLHPGVAKGAHSKSEGIDALARALNKQLKVENDITIVLENTIHGNLSVGSDLLDFQQLLTKLDHPEKVSFCIDTAHAFAFGYNIASRGDQDFFISFIDSMIGIDRVALIHLNDSKKKLGSRIDQHAVPGHGHIGKDALKRFMLHERLADIPIILELPALAQKEERVILQEVRSWLVE